MDLQEWELLPDDGFLQIHDDDGKKIFSRKYGMDSVLKVNHFIFSSPDRVPKQLVPVPIQLEPVISKTSSDHHEVLVKDIPKLPMEISTVSSPRLEMIVADQEQISQVSFKKKETEFVDMKMDSPKSNSRAVLPQIDAAAGMFHFVDKDEGQSFEFKTCSPKVKVEKEMATKKNNQESNLKKEASLEEERNGFNLWKWSSTGIGAIFSFGIAAATVCIYVLGSHQRSKNQQQNQNLRFEIYTDDKRIKQVVHHASKLNEAISAARGVPLTRAHITVGGNYDCL